MAARALVRLGRDGRKQIASICRTPLRVARQCRWRDATPARGRGRPTEGSFRAYAGNLHHPIPAGSGDDFASATQRIPSPWRSTRAVRTRARAPDAVARTGTRTHPEAVPRDREGRGAPAGVKHAPFIPTTSQPADGTASHHRSPPSSAAPLRAPNLRSIRHRRRSLKNNDARGQPVRRTL